MTKQTQEEKPAVHPSQRGVFAYELHKQMTLNPSIYLLMGDLGWGMFDRIREDYPNRALSAGASEQAMLDMAVGLAHTGKIPVVYSITPFLIYRAFETLRTYIDHERVNVKLIGSGRDKDYAHDGFSHDATDVKKILDTLPTIGQLYPETKEEIPTMLEHMLRFDGPLFISLKR